jgi:hypothetical protein
METKFEACFQVMVFVVVLQLSAHGQEKPPFSAEIVVRTVPAVQRALGITKSYDVILVNKSGATLFVNQYEFTDDIRQKYSVTPFALQRWNREAKRRHC